MKKIKRKLKKFTKSNVSDPFFLIGDKGRGYYYYRNGCSKYTTLKTDLIWKDNLKYIEKNSCLYRIKRANKCLMIEDLFDVIEDNINTNFKKEKNEKSEYIHDDIWYAKYTQKQVLEIFLLELENVPIMLTDEYIFILYSRAYYSGKKTRVDIRIQDSLSQYRILSSSVKIAGAIRGVFAGMYGIAKQEVGDSAILTTALYNTKTGCFIENITKYFITKDICVLATDKYLLEIDLHCKKTSRHRINEQGGIDKYFECGFYVSPFTGTIYSVYFPPRKIDFIVSRFTSINIAVLKDLAYVQVAYKDIYGKSKHVYISNNSMFDGIDIEQFEKYKVLEETQFGGVTIFSYDDYYIVKYLGHYILIDDWKPILELNVIKDTPDDLYIYMRDSGIIIFSKITGNIIGRIKINRNLYKEFFKKNIMNIVTKIDTHKKNTSVIVNKKYYEGGFKCSLYNLNTRLECRQQEK